MSLVFGVVPGLPSVVGVPALGDSEVATEEAVAESPDFEAVAGGMEGRELQPMLVRETNEPMSPRTKSDAKR